jgi:hypothetical protein
MSNWSYIVTIKIPVLVEASCFQEAPCRAKEWFERNFPYMPSPFQNDEPPIIDYSDVRNDFEEEEEETVVAGEFSDIMSVSELEKWEAEVMKEAMAKTKAEEKDGLATLARFWIPVHAFEGRKGIIYESRYSGQRIFLKHVNRKQHFMRKYNSWAINEDILAELVEKKVEQVYINVKDEGLYMTTVEKYQEKSIIDEYHDHGMQAFLEEKFWEKVG